MDVQDSEIVVGAKNIAEIIKYSHRRIGELKRERGLPAVRRGKGLNAPWAAVRADLITWMHNDLRRWDNGGSEDHHV